MATASPTAAASRPSASSALCWWSRCRGTRGWSAPSSSTSPRSGCFSRSTTPWARGLPTCCRSSCWPVGWSSSSGCWCSPSSSLSRPRSTPISCSTPSTPSVPSPGGIRTRRASYCCTYPCSFARTSSATAASAPCRRSRSTVNPIWR